MSGQEKDPDLPGELKDKLTELDSSLTILEANLQPLLNTSLGEMSEKLDALDKAKMDLVAVYALNSLFWVYLNVNGINPKDHPIKQELERIKGYMGRVKEIQDKVKAPKLDKSAAKRFVKSALWQAALKQTLPTPDTTDDSTDTPAPAQDEQVTSSSQVKGDNTQKKSKASLWKAAQQKQATHKRFADDEPQSSQPSKKKKGKKK